MNIVTGQKKSFLKSSSPLVYLYIFFPIVILLYSCGYTNPYVQKNSLESHTRTLHISTWDNRTNELGLESEYFRILNGWFKRSGRINVIFNDETDLKLTGEISSIDLPGLFYDSFEEALEIKLKLTISFTLFDNHTNAILWQEKQYLIHEPFLLDPAGVQTQYNKQRALLRIGDEIGELIYLRTHEIVNNMP